jgi:hypothetical protein
MGRSRVRARRDERAPRRSDRERREVFPNCKAVNKIYAHGIAKNFTVTKRADGLTHRPTVRER